MSDSVADRRDQLREDGLEALGVIVRAIQSNPGTGQVGKLVRFVAGCYNSAEYPFELDLLRALDTKLAASCLTYLAYDALGEKEIHHHLPGGDQTLHRWLEEYGLKPVAPTLEVLPADERIDLNAKLVTYGHAPGYRSVNLVFDVEGLDGRQRRRLDLQISARDGEKIRAHVEDVHRFAWRDKGPLDRAEGEQRPKWA
jgi:hypothetical protein